MGDEREAVGQRGGRIGIGQFEVEMREKMREDHLGDDGDVKSARAVGERGGGSASHSLFIDYSSQMTRWKPPPTYHGRLVPPQKGKLKLGVEKREEAGSTIPAALGLAKRKPWKVFGSS
jgi:hypothetical protein